MHSPSARRVTLVAICVSLAALTFLLPSAPSYDPWAWLIWGREVLEGDLRTASGPSWKPLAVLLTAPLSLVGQAAPDLWLFLTRAATFGAVVAGASVALRLGGRAAALIAGVLLLSGTWLWEPVLLGNSEGALILFVLAAVERHLAGRVGQAFALAVAAALLRPEAWPFVALYATFLAYSDRRRLRWVLPSLLVIPALWLLPELWGSGDLWRAAARARQADVGAPAFAARPSLAVFQNAIHLTPVVVWVGLLAGLLSAWGQRRRADQVRAVLWFGALGLSWLIVVAAMAELGFSGINRYLIPPVVIAHVMGGVGFGWTFRALLASAERRPGTRAAVAGLALVALVGVIRAGLDWPRMVDAIDRPAVVTNELPDAVSRAGGPRRLKACGSLYASFRVIPPVAWALKTHLEDIGTEPRPPGAVLRARLFTDEPIDPPRSILADAPGRRVAARTRHWEIETACGG